MNTSEGQTQEPVGGMKWVKASERLPGNDNYRHVKIDGIPRMGNFFNITAGKTAFNVSGPVGNDWIIPFEKFSGIEWLDENYTPPPAPIKTADNNIWNEGKVYNPLTGGYYYEQGIPAPIKTEGEAVIHPSGLQWVKATKRIAWRAWKEVYTINCTYNGDEFEGYDWGMVYREFLPWWTKYGIKVVESVMGFPISEDVPLDGYSTVLEIDELLHEFYTTNRPGRETGFGRSVIQKIIKQVSEVQKELYSVSAKTTHTPDTGNPGTPSTPPPQPLGIDADAMAKALEWTIASLEYMNKDDQDISISEQLPFAKEALAGYAASPQSKKIK